MVVDRHIAAEDAVVHDLHCGKPSAVTVLPACQHDLHGLEGLDRNDAVVVARVEVLVAVVIVPFVPVLVHIGGEGLPGQNVTAVPFVAEDVAYRAFVPLDASDLRLDSDICEQRGDLLHALAREVGVENESDDLRFRFVYLKSRVLDVPAGHVFRPVVPKGSGSQQLAVFETLLQRPVHAFALLYGFLLGECRQEGKHKL